MTERPIELPESEWWKVPPELGRRAIEVYNLDHSVVLLVPHSVDLDRLMVIRDGEEIKLNSRLRRDSATGAADIWLEYHGNVTYQGILEEIIDPYFLRESGVFVADPFAVWSSEEETMVPNGVVETRRGYLGIWKLIDDID